MFVADTNLLLYAVNTADPRHTQARSCLTAWLGGGEDMLLTWGIVYEFLRVATHRSVFARPLTFQEAWGFLGPVLANPRVRILVESEDHAELIGGASREVPTASGNLIHDLHTALLMRGEGISEIRTSDTDFHRFPWLTPVDPFGSS